MRSLAFRRSAIAAAVLAALSIGYVEAGLPGLTRTAAQSSPLNAPTLQVQAPQVPMPIQGAALPDFSAIVQANGPSVVNITVIGKAGKGADDTGGPQLDPDDPYYEFFKRFAPNVPRGQQTPAPRRGQGSGFIVSSDGVILTNAHVVDGAQEVTVKLTDKREFKARVIGSDRRSDVAVLRIDATGLPAVRIGSPANVKVGAWVLAIGSPFGFENTATSGIVSAKSRVLPDGTYVPFIQTDVAVNPGNSGGPLFNMQGEVIGINSQIYSRSGGYQGVSFAIPIDVVTKVKDQLIAHGRVTRSRIGVGIQDVNQALADSFGLKRPQGALVSSVENGSPAQKAGLVPGDVIVAVNGNALADSSELPSRIAEMKPGDRTGLDVVRNGETRRIEVTLAELRDPQVAAVSEAKTPQGRLGVAVRPLTPNEQREAGSSGGVVVEEVSGAAAQAGIRPGDVILALNGTAVKTADDLRRLVSKAGKRAALLVQREDGKLFVPLDLS